LFVFDFEQEPKWPKWEKLIESRNSFWVCFCFPLLNNHSWKKKKLETSLKQNITWNKGLVTTIENVLLISSVKYEKQNNKSDFFTTTDVYE
jgi:uncharacterized membrane protein